MPDMSKLNKIIRIIAVAVIAAAAIYQAYLAVSVMVQGDIRHGIVYALLSAVVAGLDGAACADLLRPILEDDRNA